MTEFRHDRKGPPRPGSSSMDHPRGVERPYVHVKDEDRAKQRAADRKAAKERGFAIMMAENNARIAELKRRLKP